MVETNLLQSITEHHPDHQQSYPWTSWTSVDPPSLSNWKIHLENCLESMTHKAVKLGTLNSQQIFATMNKWHGLNTSLRRVLQGCKVAVPEKASVSFLWERAVCALSVWQNADENIDGLLGLDEKGGGALSVEDYQTFNIRSDSTMDRGEETQPSHQVAMLLFFHYGSLRSIETEFW